MAENDGNVDDRLPQLQPRDILSPSATLLGFIITALGIVISLAGDQSDFLNNIFYILLLAIIFIILSAILTVISSIRKSKSAWWWARTIYVASWIFLGLIVIIILIGIVFGVKALQIQLPDFNQNIISLLGLTSAAISLILSLIWVREFERDLKNAISKLNTSLEKDEILIDNTIKNITTEQEQDKEMSFMRIFIDIEKTLREIVTRLPDYTESDVMSIRRIVGELTSRELIDKNIGDAFFVINRIRNQVVHGGTVSKNEIDMALNIGASLLIEFVRILHTLRL